MCCRAQGVVVLLQLMGEDGIDEQRLWVPIIEDCGEEAVDEGHEEWVSELRLREERLVEGVAEWCEWSCFDTVRGELIDASGEDLCAGDGEVQSVRVSLSLLPVPLSLSLLSRDRSEWQGSRDRGAEGWPVSFERERV